MFTEENEDDEIADDDERVRYNEEHHIFIEDARKIKSDVKPGDELVFSLENF